MRKGRQGKRTPQAIIDKALELAHGGNLRGKALIRQLELELPDQREEIPSPRTIRGWLSAARQVGREPWTLADAVSPHPIVAEEDLPLVLGVLHDLADRVGVITREEAPWVARLRRIAPGRAAWAILAYARMYARRSASGTSTADLDREVARWAAAPRSPVRIPVNPETLPIIGRPARRPRKERNDG